MLTVTVTKPSPDCKLGIRIEENCGQIFVTRVSRSGLFAHTSLRPGCEIVMVNSVPVDGFDLPAVSQLLVQAQGRLTLHVLANVPENEENNTTTTIMKSDRTSRAAKPERQAISAPAPIPQQSRRPKSQSQHRTSSGIAPPAPAAAAATATTIRATSASRLHSQEQPLFEADFERNSATNFETSQHDTSPGAIEVLLDEQRYESRSAPSVMSRRVSSTKPSSSIPSSNNRNQGTLVTIVVPHTAKLGLRLQQTPDGQHVFVRRIDAESIFWDTEMRVGMRLISINDYDTVGLNVDEVSQLFRERRRDGILTVMAMLLGPADQASNKEALQEVSNQNIAADPSGTRPTPDNLQQRFSRYKSARDSTSSRPPKLSQSGRKVSTIVRASAYKRDRTQSTGLRLKESFDRRHINIAMIQPDSPFADTGIQVGMRVLSINGTKCANQTVQQVAQAFRESVGTITIEVMHCE